jgi:hypothetical protein
MIGKFHLKSQELTVETVNGLRVAHAYSQVLKSGDQSSHPFTTFTVSRRKRAAFRHRPILYYFAALGSTRRQPAIAAGNLNRSQRAAA